MGGEAVEAGASVNGHSDVTMLNNGSSSAVADGDGNSSAMPDYCTFEPVGWNRFVLVVIIGTPIALCGIITNCLLVCLLFRRKHRSSPMLYMGVMAILDVLICTTYIFLFSLDAIGLYFMIEPVWRLWHLYVMPLLTLSRITQFASTYMVLCATFERFTMVFEINQSPLPSFRSAGGRLKVILSVILVGSLLRFATIFEYEIIPDDACGEFANLQFFPGLAIHYWYNTIYNIYIMQVVQLFIPFLTLFILNVVIVIRMRQQVSKQALEEVQTGDTLTATTTMGGTGLAAAATAAAGGVNSSNITTYNFYNPISSPPSAPSYHNHQNNKNQNHYHQSSPPMVTATANGGFNANYPIKYNNNNRGNSSSAVAAATNGHHEHRPSTMTMTTHASFATSKETIDFVVQQSPTMSHDMKSRSMSQVSSMVNHKKKLKSATYTMVAIVSSYIICNSLDVGIKFMEKVNKEVLLKDDKVTSTSFYTISTDIISFNFMFNSFIRLFIYMTCNAELRADFRQVFLSRSQPSCSGRGRGGTFDRCGKRYKGAASSCSGGFNADDGGGVEMEVVGGGSGGNDNPIALKQYAGGGGVGGKGCTIVGGGGGREGGRLASLIYTNNSHNDNPADFTIHDPRNTYATANNTYELLNAKTAAAAGATTLANPYAAEAAETGLPEHSNNGSYHPTTTSSAFSPPLTHDFVVDEERFVDYDDNEYDDDLEEEKEEEEEKEDPEDRFQINLYAV